MLGQFLVVAGALSLVGGSDAARACGNATSTYQWRVNDVRFDGADPSKPNGSATIAVSLILGTLFECVAQWPESWAGWYEGGSNIIWSDCIWTGAGPTSDKTASFAFDLKSRTMYLSHTFECSNQPGTEGLATGSLSLNIDCTTSTDGIRTCIPTSGIPSPSITTRQTLPQLEASAACANNSQVYQSWQLNKWRREFEMNPGSSTIKSDTGPSFVLSSMANTDVFNCTTSGKQNNTFDGTCQPAAGGVSSSSAKFHFDREKDMLTVTQNWDCGNLTSFQAVGVGYVQARCDRHGNILSCTSDPVWIGTKTI